MTYIFIIIFFNASLSFTPEVTILWKKVWRLTELGVRVMDFDIPVFGASTIMQ